MSNDPSANLRTYFWMLLPDGSIRPIGETEQIPFDPSLLRCPDFVESPVFTMAGKLVGDVLDVSDDGPATVMTVGVGGEGSDRQYPLGYVEKEFPVKRKPVDSDPRVTKPLPRTPQTDPRRTHGG